MHQYFHATLGFCMWDLLALLILAVMVAVLVIYICNQKKRQSALEYQLAEVLGQKASGTRI